MTPTLTLAQPIPGPVYDRSDPATRQPWLETRFGGITATEMRKWNQPAERRKIITEKVTRVDEAVGHMARYYNHGHLREPMIAEWVQGKFGITPSNRLYHHPENPRFMATPDGLYLDPWTSEYHAGGVDAIVLEVKTAVEDLTPGPLDAAGVLISLTPGNAFAKTGYYRQVQWQMFVMNAVSTLFVHERRTRDVDPETGTFSPDGPPQIAWIPRDQEFIDRLVVEAEEALDLIDAARAGLTIAGLPVASDLPSEHAALAAEYLQALDQEKVAAAAKAKAFAALKDVYLAPGTDDTTIDAGFARVTASTSADRVQESFDEEQARADDPAYWAAHDERVRRYTTSTIIPGKRSLKVTPAKGDV